ncbi:ABC transporter ATP-binding protein [Kribbella lupini]|uniref:ABC transporter ATP-binding protein n=1 Tax=Kribbella lupini TaxID=291602 RepID=A0ABP4ND97_9ACTN
MLTSESETRGAQRPREDGDILTAHDVHAGYGGFDILQGITLAVPRHQITCIVGPNGSGKSTAFKAIYGLIKIRLGTVDFEGQNITGQRPQDLLKLGIAMLPQLSTVFPGLTVEENLALGMYVVRDKRRIKARIDEIFDLFPRLRERRRQHASTLSGGERRALEIGRTLMLDPRLVLLDEPSVGLSPNLVSEVFAQLVELKEETGISVLMVEQNAKSALSISDLGYVIQRGRVSHTGSGAELLGDPEVRHSFLGGMD